MATDPQYTPSQHSSQYAPEHHLRPLRTKVRLKWPLDKRSGPFSPSDGERFEWWDYIQANPPWPWNIRVLANGTVEQREGMTQDELNEARWVLWGGHRYDMEAGSELHAILVAAGYEFETIEVPT